MEHGKRLTAMGVAQQHSFPSIYSLPLKVHLLTVGGRQGLV